METRVHDSTLTSDKRSGPRFKGSLALFLTQTNKREAHYVVQRTGAISSIKLTLS